VIELSSYSEREAEPRRWAWWFGAPFLALGALAWFLQEDRLVPLVMLLFGASGVALAIDGIRTGVVEVKFGTYARLQQPISFWFHVVVFFLIGIGMIAAVGVRLLINDAG
jgi:hypothetical protein